MRIRVEFEMEIPEATYDEIYDWLRFELNINGVLSGDNPLRTCVLEANPDYSLAFDVEE
jgi:hypothetical protein